jgi:hypothetical protein
MRHHVTDRRLEFFGDAVPTLDRPGAEARMWRVANGDGRPARAPRLAHCRFSVCTIGAVSTDFSAATPSEPLARRYWRTACLTSRRSDARKSFERGRIAAQGVVVVSKRRRGPAGRAAPAAVDAAVTAG